MKSCRKSPSCTFQSQRDNRPVFHDQHLLRNGNVPHPARDGHIRATGLPVIGNEVFDGHFRMVRQTGGKFGETAVQFFGLLRGKFAPFGGLPGSFPDGYSAMMLVGARLRHISTTKWGTRQYMNTCKLYEVGV